MGTDKVYVNCAFVDQQVTGQQRYAHEVTARLPAEWLRLAPTGIWKRSKALVWAWTIIALPWIARRGVLLSLTSRAPVWHPRHVLTVHDLFVIEHPEWYSTSYAATHAPLLRWQLRTARDLVAVSEPVAQQIASRLGRRPAVAPNAPSPVFQPEPHSDAPVSLRGLPVGRYFVVVGNQEPRKNLATLAAAYAHLSDAERVAWPLVVVGGTAGIYREARIDWPSGTQLLGYIGDAELAGLYAGSGAVLLASLAEGFGLPLVEASAAGAPRLVVSDISVFQWICGDDATYVAPLSADAWAEAMRRVMRDDVPRCSPALANPFSWDAAAETIRQVVGSASVPTPAGMSEQPPKVVVVVATAGRPEVTNELLADLRGQTYPHEVILSVPDAASLPSGVRPGDPGVSLGARGLCAQRNAGLRAAVKAGADVVVMFDDDAVPRPDYVEQVVAHLEAHPSVVAVTGRVVLDGATAPEAVDRATAQAALAASGELALRAWTDCRELYGCNFAFRTAGIGGEEFDERLPAYGWLEDHDFARRLMRYGRLHQVSSCVAVHRGVKSGGRMAHERLGYAQVMNPFYLWRKGSFPLWLMLHETAPRVTKNAARAFGLSEENRSRRRRLRGNLLALGDIGRGRVSPERMIEVK